MKKLMHVRRTRALPALALCLALAFWLSGCALFGGDDTEYTNWEPELSPDGRFLAYESSTEQGLEICVMDVETGEIRQLTSNEDPDWGPTWSPDGSRIAFASSREGNVDVYVIDVESLASVRLTTHEQADLNAHWAVDGLIYFNSDRSGAWEIYTIEPTEKRLTKLTSVAP